jgi:protein phosphatase 2C family protein 2/3
MLLCVWDGHGGKEVAEFTREKYKAIFMETKEFKSGNFKDALIQSFLILDALVEKTEFGKDAGCTSNVVYVNKEKIYCANAGDSRSVLCSNDHAVKLSEDHKPDNAIELDRIKKANHFVADSRVDGNLALSRAFGDFQYKDHATLAPRDQAVSCYPDVTVTNRKA